jgi:hypothetical protein
MNTAHYLYGDKANTEQWNSMSYPDVLELKIKLALANIKHLYTVDWKHRDFVRANAAANAIKHNSNLLNELKEKE